MRGSSGNMDLRIASEAAIPRIWATLKRQRGEEGRVREAIRP
jgi:hypothetical protein